MNLSFWRGFWSIQMWTWFHAKCSLTFLFTVALFHSTMTLINKQLAVQHKYLTAESPAILKIFWKNMLLVNYMYCHDLKVAHVNGIGVDASFKCQIFKLGVALPFCSWRALLIWYKYLSSQPPHWMGLASHDAGECVPHLTPIVIDLYRCC